MLTLFLYFWSYDIIVPGIVVGIMVRIGVYMPMYGCGGYNLEFFCVAC